MTNTPQDHARLSASGAHRWMECPASVAMEDGLPDESSKFAEEGTVFHEVVAQCLISGDDPWGYRGRRFRVVNGKVWISEDEPASARSDNTYVVDQDMIEHVVDSINLVDDFTPHGADVYIEERVEFSEDIGVPDSFGTSDVIIVTDDEICPPDHKYGMGVQVDAEENPQLMLYALGALRKHGKGRPIKQARLVINQPRLQHLSEWTCSIEHLQAFGRRAKAAAKRAMEAHAIGKTNLKALEPYFNPGEKQCRFCKAARNGTCPALTSQVTSLVADDFVNLDDEDAAITKLANGVRLLEGADNNQLAVALRGAPLVEIWLKGVREAGFKALMRGEKVGDFKIVRGKLGKRTWKVSGAAEIVMDMLGVDPDVMYKRSVISPTDAEKVLKKSGTFELLSNLVKRNPGKLSIADADDKRDAVVLGDIDDDFDNLDEGEE